jgi:uncharacterized protein
MMNFLTLVTLGTACVLTVMFSPADRARGDTVTLNAEPFALTDVRLLDGPFRVAQQADARYMLSLDPDRLLYNFRINAGLPSTAEPLGGWESPTCELRGHFMGHYLSACSLMYQSTGDPEWKRRVDYLVAELAKCQDAMGDGYLSAFPKSQFDRLESGQHVWAPYYTIHKIMAGLIDAYRLCGNQQALEVAKKMASYFGGRLTKLSDEQIENLFHTTARGPGNEYGGMSDVLHDLYSITGDPSILKTANLFDRNYFADPLAANQDELAGLHANTHIPQVEGFARHYEVTGEEKYRLAADHFWEIVTQRHSFVTGSNSFSEHFMQPGIEASNLVPTTAESCNVYNMLKLTRHLFEWEPKASYADYYERALFNHILGSIDPETGMTEYFLSLAPGHFKVYGTPTQSFWCCTGTGIENHAKYGDSIYFHKGDTLWVNLFIASELTWKDVGLVLRQETNFPSQEGTTLIFRAQKPVKATVNVRVPYWATQGVTISVDGKVQPTKGIPESYEAITREWQDGDRVEVSMPMSLHLHHATDLADNVAVMYGPIVLAGDLGTTNVPNPQEAKDQNAFNKMPRVAPPSLATQSDDVASWLKPVPGEALTFRTDGVGKPEDITMIPLYEIHRQRYTVYWKMNVP